MEKDHNKVGFVGRKRSFAQLEFEQVQTPINLFDFMIMKSYGKRWDNSRIEVIATSSNIETWLIVLEGFHDSNESVTYSYECPLENETSKESDLSLNIQLADRNAFEFSSIAIFMNKKVMNVT